MGRPSLALTFSSAAYIATGYLVSVGLARMLAPAGFGTYAVVTAILTIVNFIVGRGVPVAASRAIAASVAPAAAVMREAWRATAVLIGATMLLVAASAVAAPQLLGEDVRTPLAVGTIAALTFAAQAMSVAPLNGQRRFGWQAATRIGYSLARVVFILVGAHLWGVTGAIIGYVAAPLAASIPAFFAPGRTDAAGEQTVPVSARNLLREALPLLLTSVWVSLLLTVDLIAVRSVASAHDTGLYGAAGTLAHVPFFLMAMLPTEALPRIAAEQDVGERRRLATRLMDDSVLMLAAPCLMLMALGAWLVELIFGASYADGGVLVAPLVVATAAVTLHSMLVAVDGAASALRRTVVLGATGTAAMAAAVAVLGSSGGIERAAWAAAAVAGLLAIIHWRMTAIAGRVGAPSIRSVTLLIVTGAIGASTAIVPGALVLLAGLAFGLLATAVAVPRLLGRS